MLTYHKRNHVACKLNSSICKPQLEDYETVLLSYLNLPCSLTLALMPL